MTRLEDIEGRSDSEDPLVTWGFHHYFHGKLTRLDLDAISKIRPIIVIHRSFHEFILNTPALHYLGITSDFVGELSPDARMYADYEKGHFSEQGLIPILPLLMKYLAEPERLLLGLKTVEQYLHKNGVTLVSNPGAYLHAPVQAAKNRVHGDAENPFRSFYIPNGLALSEKFPINRLVEESRRLLDSGAGKVEYLPQHIKLFTDGAMYSQNMMLRDGYLDGHKGTWLMNPVLFAKVFQTFWEQGYQIHIHQNGDAALDIILDVLEQNLDRFPREDHRTTLVHFGYSRFEQVDQLKRLGVLVSANPYYITALSDLYSRVGVGEERSREMVRLGDLDRSGIPFALHSDMPMAPAAPLLLMHSAVNRSNFAGKVAGSSQRISAEQALRGVTINAAFILGMESEYGSIRKGKRANLTVLSENPLKVDPEKIKDIRVLATIEEGRYLPLQD